MHNFSLILFRNIHSQFLRLKSAFFTFQETVGSHLKLTKSSCLFFYFNHLPATAWTTWMQLCWIPGVGKYFNNSSPRGKGRDEHVGGLVTKVCRIQERVFKIHKTWWKSKSYWKAKQIRAQQICLTFFYLQLY